MKRMSRGAAVVVDSDLPLRLSRVCICIMTIRVSQCYMYIIKYGNAGRTEAEATMHRDQVTVLIY